MLYGQIAVSFFEPAPDHSSLTLAPGDAGLGLPVGPPVSPPLPLSARAPSTR